MHQLPPWLGPAPTSAEKQILATAGQIAAAFGVWEIDFQRAPQQFLTADEMARTNPLSIAGQRADTLCAYLRQVSA